MTVKDTLEDLKRRSSGPDLDPDLFRYFQKLALLELCGWIEMEQDEMVRECAKHIGSEAAKDPFLMDQIKRTSGFTYEDHFRKLLLTVCGLGQILKIEKALDQQLFEGFKRELNQLVEKRNGLAHTYLLGSVMTLDSLGVCITTHSKIEAGLKAITIEMRKLRLLP
jgi:hypothetical protein